VLQPNFRGSSGYGDAWYRQNGFRSWPTAIGDVLDAGRWLVAQGIADPGKLGIVGWSYGGYAALQAAVTDSGVFKAVVAIAPVTDLNELREEEGDWSDYDVVSQLIGEGPGVRAGSRRRTRARSRFRCCCSRCTRPQCADSPIRTHGQKPGKSRGSPRARDWDNLDHQLEDSGARAEMLRKSDEFLRRTFGI